MSPRCSLPPLLEDEPATPRQAIDNWGAMLAPAVSTKVDTPDIQQFRVTPADTSDKASAYVEALLKKPHAPTDNLLPKAVCLEEERAERVIGKIPAPADPPYFTMGFPKPCPSEPQNLQSKAGFTQFPPPSWEVPPSQCVKGRPAHRLQALFSGTAPPPRPRPRSRRSTWHTPVDKHADPGIEINVGQLKKAGPWVATPPRARVPDPPLAPWL